MKVTNIIKGLEIIQKYKPENESDYHFRAEHDEIWVGSLNWNISEEDIIILEDIGWNQDKSANGWNTSI